MLRYLLSPQVGPALTGLVFRRGLLYSSKKGVSRNWLAWIQQPIDLSLSGIRRWLKRSEYEMLLNDHKYMPERHHALGPDLATAHFVVARMGGVKFENLDQWIYQNKSGKYGLPSMPSTNLRLEAIDLSKTNAFYTSFDNFVNLRSLKYLSVSQCANIDDWCLDRLVQLRSTLLVLDVSGCPLITERGIASLHKLSSLKRLVMRNLPGVKHYQLTRTMLEAAMPGCVVEGDEISVEGVEDAPDALPAFIQHYQDTATGMLSAAASTHSVNNEQQLRDRNADERASKVDDEEQLSEHDSVRSESVARRVK